MTTQLQIDQIWSEFDSYLNENKETSETVEIDNLCCKLCGSKYNNWEFADICKDCGYVNKEYKFLDQDTLTNSTQEPFKKIQKGNAKMLKLNDWFMWSEQEKQDYKLKLYIEEKCKLLELNDSIVMQIVDCVTRLFTISKMLLLGTKRSKIKDSIILVFASRLSSISNKNIERFKKDRKIDIKHITKAEKIILEITQKDNLLNTILTNNNHTNSPFDIIEKKLDMISELYSYKSIIKKVIDIIVEYDILLDNTPMSIGVTSIYYVVQKLGINVHLKSLCEVFNISVVTVSKTMQKLNSVDEKLWNKINS